MENIRASGHPTVPTAVAPTNMDHGCGCARTPSRSRRHAAGSKIYVAVGRKRRPLDSIPARTAATIGVMIRL